MRILIVSPAGRVYQKDKVEWYARSQRQIEREYFNIGDMVVYDSTLKILSFDHVEGAEITNVSDWLIDRYQGFDYFVIRPSNFINNEMSWQRALEVFERVQIPIYAIGVGGQTAGSDRYALVGENHTFWKIVSERCKTIGVRGEFTANLLNDNGIKNVEVVGCPSIFRCRNRALQIPRPSDVRSVAFSIRREVSSSYSDDVMQYYAAQRNLLLNTMDHFETTLTIHGEPEEKAFYFRNKKNMHLAEEEFLQSGWWTADTQDRLRTLYKEDIFFFLRVEDYDDFIKDRDFAIGYRVHGVLPALANGIPGILVKYDSRSAELAKTHAIPSLEVNSDVDVEEVIRNISFDDFNVRYPIAYDKMVEVLNSNGIAHRL